MHSFLEFTTSKGKPRLINITQLAEVYPHGSGPHTVLVFTTGRTLQVYEPYEEVKSRIHACVGLSPSNN